MRRFAKFAPTIPPIPRATVRGARRRWLNWGGWRTPDVRQGEMAECGLAALASLMAHHGVALTMVEIRALAATTLYGSTLSAMRQIAIRQGLDARVSRVEQVAELSGKLPCIVHLRFIHFAVLEAVNRDHVRLNDPLTGPRRVLIDEFERDFTGVVMELTPTTFTRRIHRTPPYRLLARALAGEVLRRGMAMAFALEGLSAAGSVAAVWFAATVVDGNAPVWPVFVALAGAAALALLARRIGVAAGQGVVEAQSASVAEHIADAPGEHFVLRSPAQHRAMLAAPTALLDAPLFTAALACTSLPILAAGAIIMQSELGVAGTALLIVELTLCALFLRSRGAPDAARPVAELPARAPTADQIRNLDHWRIGNGAEAFFRAITGQHAAGAVSAIRGAERGAALVALRVALATVRTGVLIALGLFLVYRTDAAIGSVTAAGILTIIASRQIGPMLAGLRRPGVTAALHRLADREGAIGAISGGSPSSPGHALEMRDVAWRPATLLPNLLTGVSLMIPARASLAVHGPPGSGLTTLCRIAAGRLIATAGEVRHGRAILLEPVFWPRAGSVRRLLSMGVSFDDEEMVALIDALGLSEVLSARGGLDLHLGFGAPELSGGQRRRLQLAAALLRRPELIVADGVFDGLDVQTAAAVLQLARRRGCAVLLTSPRQDLRDLCDAQFSLSSAA